MSQNHLVSVIIATFNRADLIGETIKSLQMQTYRNWECIIVDDDSSDQTEQLVNQLCLQDNRISYYKRPLSIPKGPNGSRNYGIGESKGSYLLFLDSDDWLLPDHVLEKTLLLDSNLEVDGVLSKTIMVDNNKNVLKKEDRTYLTPNLLEDFISLKISWYMHDILWRKSFLKDKVLFNENLQKMLDRDFHIRRISENPKLILLDKFLSLYRIHDNSNSSNSSYLVAESRHDAIINIIKGLKQEKKLSNFSKFYFFKHQVQNLVILYKHPNCLWLYLDLISKTFVMNYQYLKWIFKFFAGYFSYKITSRGLRFIQ